MRSKKKQSETEEAKTEQELGWGIKGTIREACAREGIVSQMVRPIGLDENGDFKQRGNDEHRAMSAVQDVVLRHSGLLYDTPHTVYQAAKLSQDVDVLTFYLEKTHNNIMFPIASKLTMEGQVEILFPDDRTTWLPYAKAGVELGQLFAKEWPRVHWDRKKKWRKIADEKRDDSKLWYDKPELRKFILSTLKTIQRPTIVVIEADKWRDGGVWPQLQNPKMIENKDVLNFGSADQIYHRDAAQFENLLAVIRMRSDTETPEYLTDTRRDFSKLAGFYRNDDGLFHYYSIGRLMTTAKNQDEPYAWNTTMLDSEIGSGIPFKYPQVVEFVPFFVRPDYHSEEGLKQLCRIPHYLRLSPAWRQGNIVHPYPMHLAKQLIDDQLWILGMK